MARRDELTIKPNERSALVQLKEALGARFELVDFRVYGSAVRGTASDDSDLDVILEITRVSSETVAQIDDIVYEVNLANDTFVSTVVFGSDELNSGPLSESPLYKAAMREGIPF